MNKINYIKSFSITIAIVLAFINLSCERGYSDDIELATFSPDGDVFIDNFSAGLDYFPFVDGGADPEAFSVVTDDVYSGSAAMRFDVPAFGNGFVGATFNTTVPRDLSGYDALTFYAKASQAATINSIGYGIDGDTNNKYQVTLNNLPVSTNWKKYVIPIPDASKLTNEKGLFWLAEGASFDGDEGGYTLWFDEVKFENLGTIGQPRPAINNGSDQTAQGNIDNTLLLSGLTHTANLENGEDVTVSAAPSYFEFMTSNPFVASVNDLGLVTIVGPGEVNPDTGLIDNTATITAKVGGIEALGSLTIESTDIQVISIFSDVFTNVPVDNYNGFYEPFQTTLGGATVENGNNIIDYTLFNFVAIEFYGRDGSGVPPIDASEMTHLHIDIRVNENVDPSDFIRIEPINNFGPSQTQGSFTITGNDLVSNEWVEFDIPFSSFAGLNERDALGALLFVSDATISNVSMDNIYFYSE